MGIKEALDRGADIVICPRVADASLVMGPAAWAFGLRPDGWDNLAAAAAGHILECGPQATGGNYAFIEGGPSLERIGYRSPSSSRTARSSSPSTRLLAGSTTVGVAKRRAWWRMRPPRMVSSASSIQSSDRSLNDS
jgi:hypothetical protein